MRRKRPVVLNVHCIRCGAKLTVVQDSAPDRERICNLCIYDEVRRESARPDLQE